MSGLRVSVPILGMMSMGCMLIPHIFVLKDMLLTSYLASEWEPWVLDKDEALPILKRAYDLGVTTVSHLDIVLIEV